MAKIGILTFHRAINNGAVLQAYALIKAFEAQGCICEDVDYTSKKILDSYVIKPLWKRTTLKSILLYFLQDKNILKTYKKFEEFRKDYLNSSDKNYDNCIKTAINDYDAFVTGSDQVWNTELTGHDLNYFLVFAQDVPKYSYAASIGLNEFPDDEKTKLKPLLESFAEITVREESAIKVIGRIAENDVRVVPDPVFLINKTEWEEAFNLNNSNQPYILFFMLHQNDEMIRFDEVFSSRTGKKLISLKNSFKIIKGMKTIKRFGPEDFLKTIAGASYVVTDSFHAASFSLILNKELYIGLKTGDLAELNTRIDGLINKFGIADRVIGPNTSFDKMNYEAINSRISEQRELGSNTLKTWVNTVQETEVWR